MLLFAAVVFPQFSAAQDLQPEAPPAHLALLDGTGTLLREGMRDEVASGMPLIPGDVLRTDRGRANVLFPDGSALDLDEFTTVELLSPTHLRLTEGHLIATVAGVRNPASAMPLVIDTPAAIAETRGPGEYQISVLPSTSGQQTELAVVRGSALLSTERGEMPLRATQRSFAFPDGVPSYPQSFNAGRADAFQAWSAALRAERSGSASAAYLPADLRMYGDVFDRDGVWGYDQSYGNVWYPAVDPSWQPYVDGYWSPLPTYGWTWIGFGRWSWATHHYGRWGFASSRWFWIPGRQWGPAWVSWGSAPGYVSWSPLGFNNQPLFGFSIATGRAAFGWTIVNRDRFSNFGRPWRGQRIVSVTPPARTVFMAHDAAPLPAARVMPRGATIPPARTRAQAPAGYRAAAPPRGDTGASYGAPGRDRGVASAPPRSAPGEARDRARLGAPSPGSSRPEGVRAVPRRDTGRGPQGAGPSAPPRAAPPDPSAAPRASGRTAPQWQGRAPGSPQWQGRSSDSDSSAAGARPPDRGASRRARPSAPPTSMGGGAPERRERAIPRASGARPDSGGGRAAAPAGGDRARGSARRAR